MKADPAVQRRLLDLAEVDAELARVTHRRRTLPEIAEIAEGLRSQTDRGPGTRDEGRAPP